MRVNAELRIIERIIIPRRDLGIAFRNIGRNGEQSDDENQPHHANNHHDHKRHHRQQREIKGFDRDACGHCKFLIKRHRQKTVVEQTHHHHDQHVHATIIIRSNLGTARMLPNR